MMESTSISLKLICSKSVPDRSSAGSVLVEFAMILPLLIFFFFASYEFSRVLRMHQLVATTAREIARDAYRQCFGEKHFSSSGESQAMANACNEEAFNQTCLKGVVDSARTLRGAALQLEAPFVQELRVVLTAFQYRKVSTGTGNADSAVRVGYYPGDLRQTTEEAETNPPDEEDFSFSRFTEEYFTNGEHKDALLEFIKANGVQNTSEAGGYSIVAEVEGTYDITRFSLLPHFEMSFDPSGGKYYYVVLH